VCDSTFFFCLPPPDLAGLEDGGGAFSFFGACEDKRASEVRSQYASGLQLQLQLLRVD
jgi:hypothetical protein